MSFFLYNIVFIASHDLSANILWKHVCLSKETWFAARSKGNSRHNKCIYVKNHKHYIPTAAGLALPNPKLMKHNTTREQDPKYNNLLMKRQQDKMLKRAIRSLTNVFLQCNSLRRYLNNEEALFYSILLFSLYWICLSRKLSIRKKL